MISRRPLMILGVIAALLTVVHETTHLVVAASRSLPYRVYLVLKGRSWQRGDIVTLRNHKTLEEQVPYLTKRVKGVEGDKISQQDGILYVNDQAIGPVQTQSSSGKALHVLSIGIIPKGYVFVAGDHPHSFDSRYQSFGLVKIASIMGRSVPLW